VVPEDISNLDTEFDEKSAKAGAARVKAERRGARMRAKGFKLSTSSDARKIKVLS
jgi:hypothetical protein